MSTTAPHRTEPSTDFPAFDDARPCPDLAVSRLVLVGLAAVSALAGALIGFLVGRAV
jgi:hypothetical protein